MSPMRLDDLLRIKEGIETTEKWEGKGLSEVEYQWLYTPLSPLRQLERVESDPLNIVLQLSGMISVYTFPKETDAIAHIHNHPQGYIPPSFNDINLFLKLLRYPSIKYALIAATSESLVSGFYCLEYHGNYSDVKKLIRANEVSLTRICSKRHQDIVAHPEKYSHIRLGMDVFTNEELITMSLRRMERSNIEHYALSMPGYKFQDWRFVKE